MTRAITLSIRVDPEHGRHEVALIHGVPKVDLNDGCNSVRQSILYPINPAKFICPQRNFSLLFLGGPNPFGLIHFLEKEHSTNLCYGVGALSAIIVADKSAEPFSIVSAPPYAPITAFERWDVTEGIMTTHNHEVVVKPSGETNHLIIPREGLDPTSALTVSELSLNLARAIRFARNYAPETLHDLEAAVADAQQTLDEIVSLRLQIRREIEANSSVDILNEIKKTLDHDLERLVQMNSALVYLTTQAFHGTPPILNNTPLVSYHSVLGTGTAWRAIARLARMLFLTLNKRHLPPALASVLLSASEITANEKTIEHYNRRIVHFSGRLGFGETDVTITIPSQVIGLCSTAEWSVVTLSHEVLHAYVKRIIAALFVVEQPGEEILNGAKGRDWHALRMSKWIATWGNQGDIDATYDAPTILRWHIFRFALAYQSAENEYLNRIRAGLIGLPENLNISAPRDYRKLIEVYEGNTKLIEEIMVHVLDLLYFYGKDAELFVESLWVTWASVPSVLGKLESYVLRTLISLTAVFDGPQFTPLTRGVEVLSAAMQKLSRLPDFHAVAQSVLFLLEQNNFKMRVDLLFPAAKKFVHVIAEICADPEVVESIFGEGDPLVGIDGECILEDGAFDATEVSNPLLLSLSILRRRLHSISDHHENFETISRESAWLLLAIASPPPKIP